MQIGIAICLAGDGSEMEKSRKYINSKWIVDYLTFVILTSYRSYYAAAL